MTGFVFSVSFVKNWANIVLEHEILPGGERALTESIADADDAQSSRCSYDKRTRLESRVIARIVEQDEYRSPEKNEARFGELGKIENQFL
jgi:hypothetical protein